MQINWFIVFMTASLSFALLGSYQVYKANQILHACENAGLDPENCCYNEITHEYLDCSLVIDQSGWTFEFVNISPKK